MLSLRVKESVRVASDNKVELRHRSCKLLLLHLVSNEKRQKRKECQKLNYIVFCGKPGQFHSLNVQEQ